MRPNARDCPAGTTPGPQQLGHHLAAIELSAKDISSELYSPSMHCCMEYQGDINLDCRPYSAGGDRHKHQAQFLSTMPMTQPSSNNWRRMPHEFSVQAIEDAMKVDSQLLGDNGNTICSALHRRHLAPTEEPTDPTIQRQVSNAHHTGQTLCPAKVGISSGNCLSIYGGHELRARLM